MQTRKQKRRRARRLDAAFKKIPPSRYSPTGKPGSTIAEAGLNFRVRNGNGCGPCSMDSGKTCTPLTAHAPGMSVFSSAPVGQTASAPVGPKGLRQSNRFLCPLNAFVLRVVKPHGRLVLVSFTHCCASTSSLSTSSSWTALQEPEGSGRSHLGVGFPLRCLQRLSHPNLATRQCRWRDNRYTIGSSIPVLSY